MAINFKNNFIQSNQTQKRSGFQRLFGMNSSKNNSSQLTSSSSNASISQQQATNESLKTNTSADNIDNILKKYASKTTSVSQPVTATPAGSTSTEAILIGKRLIILHNN